MRSKSASARVSGGPRIQRPLASHSARSRTPVKELQSDGQPNEDTGAAVVWGPPR